MCHIIWPCLSHLCLDCLIGAIPKDDVGSVVGDGREREGLDVVDGQTRDRAQHGLHVHRDTWMIHSGLAQRIWEGYHESEDAQGKPTQSHISPSKLVYEDKRRRGHSSLQCWTHRDTLHRYTCLHGCSDLVNPGSFSLQSGRFCTADPACQLENSRSARASTCSSKRQARPPTHRDTLHRYTSSQR